MSNLIPMNIEVPAHLANRMGQPSALSESLKGGLSMGAAYPRISIKGSRFRLVEGGTESVLDATSLEVVMVGANPGISKAWYASAWNPDAEAKAPDCFTMDGIRPDPTSGQPQNDLCASCPLNAWGSKKTPDGKDIKACSDKKRLAVVAADDPTGPIYLLEVTAAALKGMAQYQRELAMRTIIPETVRTIISFDTDASYPKLKFGYGGFLTAEIQTEVDKLLGSVQVMEIIGTDAAPHVATPAVAQQVAAPVAATPTPAPEPVAEAPAKGSGFGTAKPAEPAAAAPVAAAPVEEPAAAPVADAGTAGLADEITALMAEVADDA